MRLPDSWAKRLPTTSLEAGKRGLGGRGPKRLQNVTATLPGCLSNLAPSSPTTSSLALTQAHLPLALHVGSSSVPIEHGVVRGSLHGLAVELNGLGPLLAGKSLIGLLFHTLQVWGQLYLGAMEEAEPSQASRRSEEPLRRSVALPEGCPGFLGPWDLHCHLEEGTTPILGLVYHNK